MLHKTIGIVFHTVKYADTSIIAKIYTEKFGLRSYMIRGVKSKKSKPRSAFLQHLSVLNMVVYENQKKHLQSIREIDAAYQYQTIPFNIEKSSILLFMNEILLKSIVEEEPNQKLFNFIYSSVVELDRCGKGYQDFHLHFMVQFSRFLGFFPGNTHSGQNEFFDLQEGVFLHSRPLHNNYLEPAPGGKLSLLLENNSWDRRICRNAAERNELLGKLIEYYRLHIEGFGDVKSHLILKQIFS